MRYSQLAHDRVVASFIILAVVGIGNERGIGRGGVCIAQRGAKTRVITVIVLVISKPSKWAKVTVLIVLIFRVEIPEEIGVNAVLVLFSQVFAHPELDLAAHVIAVLSGWELQFQLAAHQKPLRGIGIEHTFHEDARIPKFGPLAVFVFEGRHEADLETAVQAVGDLGLRFENTIVTVPYSALLRVRTYAASLPRRVQDG